MMSTMTDYDAGRLVALVDQLSIQLAEHQRTTKELSQRVNCLEKQLVKGKGFLAGAMLLSMAFGGIGSSVLTKWLGM
jgi:hypothetical protein